MSASAKKLLLALGLAAVLVAVAIVVSQSGSDEPEPPAEDGQILEALEGIPQRGTVLGDPAAPVQVTEFGDMQCPFCADFARDGFAEVVDRYVRDGSISLDFQVLAFLGPDSEALARLVAAASLQDLTWQAVEILYARQGAENSGFATEDFLREAAEAIPGLDAERALADRASPEVDAVLAEAEERAGEAGVEGTPSFFWTTGSGDPQPLDPGSLDGSGFAAAIEPVLRDADGG